MAWGVLFIPWSPPKHYGRYSDDDEGRWSHHAEQRVTPAFRTVKLSPLSGLNHVYRYTTLVPEESILSSDQLAAIERVIADEHDPTQHIGAAYALATGWPFRCLLGVREIRLTSIHYHGFIDLENPPNTNVGFDDWYRGRLPYLVAWRQMVFNASFYGAGVYGVLAALGACVRRRRNRHGVCKNCRYDLAGITSGVCPECGTVNDYMRETSP